MKLTKMSDGRILLEVAGRAHALSAFEIAQLADQLGAATEPVDISGAWNALNDRNRDLARVTQELSDTGAQAARFWKMLCDRETELVELRKELAEHKATRATGGPWRPADQTWVSADIEPPASASDDTAPPLFRGLTVDKKETA